jgi:Xaa-Pro aminopeptidase
MTIHETRLLRLREYMAGQQLEALFIMMSSDMQYLTGIPREPHNPTDDNKHGDELYGAYMTVDGDLFIVAPRMGASSFVRYHAQDKPWIKDVLVLNDGDDLLTFAKRILTRLGSPRTVGVSARTWARSILLLQEAGGAVVFSDASRIIAKMRAVKDEHETRIMKEAGVITDRVFAAVLKQLRLGMTQYDIAREVNHQIIVNGGSGTSFHTSIYVTGEGIGWVPGPDGKTGFTPLQPGAVVAFDFGITYKGYVSDFGRNVFCGEPAPDVRRHHDLVMASQAAAMAAMKSGQVTARQLNEIARKVLDEAGVGQYFTHRLGHGIGIDVHEPPFLYELDETILDTGMCFTVEPSIWVPNGALVRVEDVVQVTPAGGVSFSNFSRDILVI